jgi:hypothetical protein
MTLSELRILVKTSKEFNIDLSVQMVTICIALLRILLLSQNLLIDKAASAADLVE